MADVKKIEAALASIQTKLDGLSGLPPDVTSEFEQIRAAAKPAPAKPTPAKKK